MPIVELLASPEAWLALVTLTALEIVLGVDNVVFISILSGRLPEHQRARARTIGLALAMGLRIVLLLMISWVMGLTKPLFSVLDHGVSGRDLILLFGGLFLLAKSTLEIHHALEGDEHGTQGGKAATFAGVLVQILILDLVFSLDSVITAVGMAKDVPVMIAAIVIAVGVMMVSAGAISRFVEKHPTVKMLALSFLVLIGFMLVVEGVHLKADDGTSLHVPKGYIYFAMGFAVAVEMLNLKVRSKRRGRPVHLRKAIEPAPEDPAAEI